MSDATADRTIHDFITALAARRSTPGGGAASATAGAIASALGAMAAAFTTGERWQDRELEARGLRERLEHVASELLQLADEDSAAFASLQAAQRSEAVDDVVLAEAERRCAAVPAAVVHLCANAGEALSGFAAQCNPHLRVDLRAAIHLLRGSAGAAHEILRINQPTAAQHDAANNAIATLDGALASLR